MLPICAASSFCIDLHVCGRPGQGQGLACTILFRTARFRHPPHVRSVPIIPHPRHLRLDTLILTWQNRSNCNCLAPLFFHPSAAFDWQRMRSYHIVRSRFRSIFRRAGLLHTETIFRDVCLGFNFPLTVRGEQFLNRIATRGHHLLHLSRSLSLSHATKTGNRRSNGWSVTFFMP